MNKLIISHATHETAFSAKCWESQRVYAERVGSRHIVSIIGEHDDPHGTKLDVISRLCSENDRVIYMDWDIEVANYAEDLFLIDSRFCMVRHPARQSRFFAGEYRAPWNCTCMMIGNGADFIAMLTEYNDLMETIPSQFKREERATNFAARKLGIEITPIEPQGFVHHVGKEKFMTGR